jgi:hypothetical protein
MDQTVEFFRRTLDAGSLLGRQPVVSPLLHWLKSARKIDWDNQLFVGTAIRAVSNQSTAGGPFDEGCPQGYGLP